MNKKMLIISLILTCIILLNGCFTSETKTQVINSIEISDNKTPPISEVNMEQPKVVNVSYDALGFELQTKESLFVLNNSLSDVGVIKLLGEPEKKSDPIVWEADGLEHQTWYYYSKGIELGFFRDEEENQIVFSIDLQAPCSMKTSRGIRIGSTRNEVLKAYEREIYLNENSVDSDSIVVGTVYGGLIFAFENDKVSSIFIGAGAE